MADGTGNSEGVWGFLTGFLPDWVLVLVLIFAGLILINVFRKTIADAASGFRWFDSLRSNPKQTLVETINPPAKEVMTPEVLNQLNRIEAKLDQREGGQPPDPEQRERRNEAARELVTDPDPDARAAVEELTSDDGNIDDAVERLEREARAATAEGAAKWRRIGDLVAGFDTTKALNAYEQAFRLDPDYFWTIVMLARSRRLAGNLGGALDLVPNMESAATTERDRSVVGSETGLLFLESGQFEVARAAYRRSLEMDEALAASNPGSAEAQRDLSVSLERLGDVEVQAGDLAAARRAYARSLEVREALAASNPGSAEAQRDLSVSLNKLGDVEVQAGDLAAARRAYARSLEVGEALAASNPGSAAAQRDLSVSLERLGDVEAQAGDLAAARRAYARSLKVREALAASNSGSAAAQRDLSVSLEKLGNLAERDGDPGAAVALYERSLPIAKMLATNNPSHPGLQNDLEITHDLEITQRRLDELKKKLGDE